MTIEGLANEDGSLHPVEQGIIDEQGFQYVRIHHGHGGVSQNKAEPRQVAPGALMTRFILPLTTDWARCWRARRTI